jgi:hypothetical protein
MLLVGQKAIPQPAAAIRSSARPLIWTQWAKTERGPTRPNRS